MIPENPPNAQPETPVDPDAVVSPKPAFTLATQQISVDPSKTYQEMEGFGASDCWLPNWIGQYWSSSRLQIANWLFSQKISGGKPQGIGLSMWRVNLGAGTADAPGGGGIDSDNANNRAEAFLATGGNYDWTKCAGQRWFMEQAKNNGVESFVLFSNSPLVQYTKNGQGRSDSKGQSNLKDDCYDDYAAYMAEVAAHFSEEDRAGRTHRWRSLRANSTRRSTPVGSTHSYRSERPPTGPRPIPERRGARTLSTLSSIPRLKLMWATSST